MSIKCKDKILKKWIQKRGRNKILILKFCMKFFLSRQVKNVFTGSMVSGAAEEIETCEKVSGWKKSVMSRVWLLRDSLPPYASFAPFNLRELTFSPRIDCANSIISTFIK